MFIFTILPELFVHLIFGLGIFLTIVGFFLSFIPFISAYKLPIKIIGFIVLVFGIYLEGGLANNKEWELKVKEVEAQVAKAEAESANLNTQLQAALSDKKQVIKEKAVPPQSARGSRDGQSCRLGVILSSAPFRDRIF